MTNQAFDCICNVDPTPAFVHPSVIRGARTHVCAGAWIGPDCHFGDDVFVGPYTQMVGNDLLESGVRVGAFSLLASYVLLEEHVSLGTGALLGEGSNMQARAIGGDFIYVMAQGRVGAGAMLGDYAFVRRNERLPSGLRRLGLRKPGGPRIAIVESCLATVKNALRKGVLPPGYEQQLQLSQQVSLPAQAA